MKPCHCCRYCDMVFIACICMNLNIAVHNVITSVELCAFLGLYALNLTDMSNVFKKNTL